MPAPDGEVARCADNLLVRPNADGTAYDPAIPLTPSYCTLSVLFSDWDRTGRRDLRTSNDRHYYGADPAGEEQLWRVDPGQPPRLYTADDGWQQLRIWGMGIASQDLSGDGMPEVYLTSQADNKLQTLTDGPSQPTYGDVALDRGVTATTPFAGDTTLPSTAWHPEFQDVNNDGLMDLYVSKGNVEAQLDYAMQDPSNLLIGQADGTFVEGAEEAGLVSFAEDSRRRARRPEHGRAARPRRGQPADTGPRLAERRGGHGRRSGSDGKLGRDPPWTGCAEPGCDRGVGRDVRVDGRVTSREITVGGGHAGGQLGWVHFGLGDAEGAEVRVTWPDGEVGPWHAGRRERLRDDRAHRGPGRPVGTRGSDRPMTLPARTARLAEIELPDFGMPDDDRRSSRRRLYADALERAARADGARAATTGSSSTPTASTARTSRS